MAQPILLIRIPEEKVKEYFPTDEAGAAFKKTIVNDCPDYDVIIIIRDGITVEILSNG